uniref:Protein HGH1 homolog n=1 Tax=Aotus nancymaae TaxID=37293 RepID=A0A2K5EHM2_AOTNA
MEGAAAGAGVSAGTEADPEAELVKLLPFLAPGARADLQAAAVRHVLSADWLQARPRAAGGAGGRCCGHCRPGAGLRPGPGRRRALVNLAADPGLHEPLLAGDPGLPARLLGRALDPQWPWAEEAAAALANLSREPAPCAALMAALAAAEPGDSVLERLVRALCTPGYNARAPLHYLAPLLSNLSQRPAARAFLLDPDRCVVQRLLPLTQYPDSSVRRGGVVGTLRNCCFEHRHHQWLLGPEVDILPFLLLPLAGPEDFSEEEMERLPVDLQYLPPDKQREPDADIRKMLVEAIMLLTATAPGRQQVRDQGAYLVLRELHGWEPESDVRTACEKLIQVLIGDEPECGMENLLEVQVPEDVEQQLQQLDQQEQEQLERELAPEPWVERATPS